MHRKRLHGNVPVLVNDAGLYLVDVHFVTCAVALLESIGPNDDVFTIGGEQMVRHRFESDRTVGLDGILSTEHPWTENQVRVTKRVIRMKMSDEKRLEFLNGETSDTFSKRRCRPANHAGTAIDQVRCVVDDNRH